MKNILILLFNIIIVIGCSSNVMEKKSVAKETNDFTFNTDKVIVLYADNNKLAECCKLYLSCDEEGFISAKLYYEDLINGTDTSNNIAVSTLVKVVFDSFCDGEIDAYSADYLDDGRLEINTNDKFTTDITNSTELTISFDYQGSEKTFVFDVGDVDFMIYPDIVYIE